MKFAAEVWFDGTWSTVATRATFDEAKRDAQAALVHRRAIRWRVREVAS